MKAVAELVGEGEGVVAPPGPVQEHVGVVRRGRVRAEGARTLAGRGGRIDPVLLDEALRDPGQLRRERVVGVEHEVSRFVPSDAAIRGGHRAGPVVVGQPVEAEQPGLQAVPALGQVVAALHGLDQRGDRLVAGLVLEVAGGQPVGVVAQPVVGGLLQEQRVQDEGPGAQTRGQAHGHGGRSLLTDRPVGVRQAGQAVLQRVGLTVEAHLQRPLLLVEQPLPAPTRGEVLLRGDALLRLAQEVRAEAAHDAEVVAAVVEALVRQQRLGAGVVEVGPLQLEEHQARAERGDPLVDGRPPTPDGHRPGCQSRSAARRSCPPGSGAPRGPRGGP